jgi:enamine deaminase RidA (YjgF/YER057c/UK114 family)
VRQAVALATACVLAGLHAATFAKDDLSAQSDLDLYIGAKYAEEDARSQATICRRNDAVALSRIGALRDRLISLEVWIVENAGADRFEAALAEYDDTQHGIYRVCPKQPIDPSKSITQMRKYVRTLEARAVKAKAQ